MTRLQRSLGAVAMTGVAALCAAAAAAADMDHAYSRGPARGRGCNAAVRAWAVEPGDDLESVVRTWSRASGWDLSWKSDYSFQIAGRATFHGTFTQALGGLMAAMQEARPSPVADIHSNCAVIISDGLSAVR